MTVGRVNSVLCATSIEDAQVIGDGGWTLRAICVLQGVAPSNDRRLPRPSVPTAVLFVPHLFVIFCPCWSIFSKMFPPRISLSRHLFSKRTLQQVQQQQITVEH